MDLTQKRTTELPLSIRDVSEGDVPFIFNSWLKSFRNGSFCQYVDNSIYFTEQHKLVEKLLKRCKIKVACEPNDPAAIYGYIVYEQIEGIWCFHYIYTKHTFRGLGVARELARSVEHDFNSLSACTHQTKLVARIAPKYNIIYHPYILINYKDTQPVNNLNTNVKPDLSTSED